MTSVHIHRSTVSLEIDKSKEIEVARNGVSCIARHRDHEALRLKVEIVEQSAEDPPQDYMPANALPPART